VEPARLIDVLKSTPQSLRAAARSLKAEQLTGAGGDGWSPLEIIRHMRAADAVLSPRIYHVLVRDNPPLPAFDERTWASLIEAAGVPLDAQLASFAIQRAELTALLRTLTPEQWLRAGTHEALGTQSVLDICAKIVDHEREHLAQLELVSRASS
jgi:hypothetical protein